MPSKIDTLVDSFTAENPAVWFGYDSDVFVSGGQLHVNATPAYPALGSLDHYDLTSSAIHVQLTQRPLLGSGETDATFGLYGSGSNSAIFILEGTVLYMREIVGGVNNTTNVVYNATTHAWWRIREAAGMIYWETAPDGVTWTTRRSKAIGSPYTDVGVALGAGNYGSLPAPGTAVWDNLNGALPLTREAVAAIVTGKHDVEAGEAALTAAGYTTHTYRTTIRVTHAATPSVELLAYYRPEGAGGMAGMVGSAWRVYSSENSAWIEVGA